MTLRNELREALVSARAVTLRLLDGLDGPALCSQFDREFSPIGWHFGHVAWQQEVWALRRVAGAPPLVPELDAVFDSFDSEKALRGARLPQPAELYGYAERVYQATLELLERADLGSSDPLLDDGHVFGFLANHERQHAEVMAAVRLLGGLYLRQTGSTPRAAQPVAQAGSDFVTVAGGAFTLGCDDDRDGWDNERRAHRAVVAEFALGRHAVCVRDFLEFMQAGGYEDDRLWSRAGAEWRRDNDVRAPLHWQRDAGGSWLRRTLTGMRSLDPRLPVSHVAYYEAEAFASFAGARLPSEAEWEYAASAGSEGKKRRFPWGDSATNPPANVGLRCLDVTEPGAWPGRSADGAEDLIGNTWEWTSSAFLPYPHFTPQPYQGYSAPWFDGRHRVARGGSYATQIEIARACFRNWYLPHVRALPLGLRLARTMNTFGTIQA